jgi:hypothetical protein
VGEGDGVGPTVLDRREGMCLPVLRWEGSPNREPAGFLNRKYRIGIPVKPTDIPI